MLSFLYSPLSYPWWLRRKSVSLKCGRPGIDYCVGKIPWRRKWQSTPALLPGKSHGRRSLIGYSPWCHKESDTNERLHFHFHSHPYMNTGKTIALTRQSLVSKVMSLLLNMLSRLAITFLPRSKVKVKESESEVAQLCWTLCNPPDCSPPGFSVHRILQARILEWVAISFSRGSSQPRDRTQVSCIAGRRFNL